MRGSRGGYSRGRGGMNSSYRGSNNRGSSGGHSSYNSGGYGGQNSGGATGDRGGRYSGNSGGGGGGGGNYRGGRGGYHNNDSFNNSGDSGSRFPRPASRYQPGERPDNYAKRPIQNSPRDRSPDRKRIRSESTRRNEDYGSNSNMSGGYHRGSGDTYGNTRYDSRHSDTRNSSNSVNNRSSYRDESSTFHSSPYRERKTGPPTSRAPPSRPRGGRIARGGSSYRGARGVALRGQSVKGIPMTKSGKLAEMAAQLRRRRLAVKRGSPDAERKLKIDKLRSSIKKTNNEKTDTAETAGDDDDENEDLDIEDGVTFDVDDDDVKESEAADTETVANTEQSDETTVLKTPKNESVIPDKAVVVASGDENALVKQESADAEEAVAEEDPKNEDASESSTRKVTRSEHGSSDKRRSSQPASRYIKLKCVHCNIPIRTFNLYNKHLLTQNHKRRLIVVQQELRAKLKAKRMSLRHKLRKEIALLDEPGNLESCDVCKATVAGGLSKHILSRGHLEIERMMFPSCAVCDVSFTEMMDYELHRCTLRHIKREHQEQQQSNVDAECDVDWKEFTTVDCIGDVDGDIEDKDDSAGDMVKDELQPTSNGEHISVGSEFIKELTVKYCEICKIYLPRVDEPEKLIKTHCAKRSHLNNYLHYKENERLRLAAVKIHQQEEKTRLLEKRKREEEKRNQDTAETEDDKTETKAANTAEEDDGIDSKIWADVDKDLGELLQAVSSENAHDDEDEEDSTTTTERYDRFKNSESGGSDENGDNVKTKVAETEVITIEDHSPDLANSLTTTK